jgi:hypothetical protein
MKLEMHGFQSVEFVKNHDVVLEHRPLTDYDIEPDPYTYNPHCKDGFIL